ncbi:MAG TPA: sn-glycerol-1-phosphate dehydrogenase [Phycisphaerae bacterium]|nr:sn-glycerol-1-phosphate dehydrogenase [Phycisphaerae bacterium]HRR84714.1 sn-glycerol-1-phosphate dehydrogenase [Phycisphaerae bacterium]
MSCEQRAQVACEERFAERVERALRTASDTREVQIGEGVIALTAEVFRRQFPESAAVVVADRNTLRAAGHRVLGLCRQAGLPVTEPVVFEDPDLHADYRHVERLQSFLNGGGAVPIAVGSGTINDLVKLAAHLCGRPYMVVATAASMDGFTASGASITRHGLKETFFCPAPRAVIADLDIVSEAPGELNAAGYADLAAKTTAGADWILADALGIEAIEPGAWDLVQRCLRQWLMNPEAIQKGNRIAIRGLLEGLLMTGLAMQHCRSSRPASGAEHQFSHLWDMEHHRHAGTVPLHGHKVGIGTLAVTMLYEELLRYPLQLMDPQRICDRQPDLESVRRQVRQTHTLPELRDVSLREVEAKHPDRKQLLALLQRLREVWPDLRERLRDQLIPSRVLCRMLQQAGAPCRPEAIGIDLPRLRRSYLAAQQIRRRFTVLDLATLTGLLPECLERLFARGGAWEQLGHE